MTLGWDSDSELEQQRVQAEADFREGSVPVGAGERGVLTERASTEAINKVELAGSCCTRGHVQRRLALSS